MYEPCAGRKPRRLAKIIGSDIELSNSILGLEYRDGTGYEASRALLSQIDGVPGERYSYGYYGSDGGYGWASYEGYRYGTESRDWGRKFLATNGGCVYIDLNHLEICIPEVRSAEQFVAAVHAMMRIARSAAVAANERLPAGQIIQVLANNSDGFGNSYGSHLNFLLTRDAYENLFSRRLHYLLYLAAYQASSIIFTGQGKVGAENGQPEVAFQLSQRADFFETLTGVQTTANRPIVNSRDEAHCGRPARNDAVCLEDEMARLHCIFYDSNLCHGATYLKVGVMQIILAMIEAEFVNPELILDDPVQTVIAWSHDPTMTATARLASGKPVSAIEMQWLFLEQASKFVQRGGCDEIVPGAEGILAYWEDTLTKLERGTLSDLAGRLDWVLKFCTICQALERRPELDWTAPEVKYLDHLYSSLHPDEGLYWNYEREGLVERLVEDEEIERLTTEPPSDTRAWARAMLLRRADPDDVEEVNWDSVHLRTRSGEGWRIRRTADLPDPRGCTEAELGEIFERLDICDIIDAIAAA